MRYLGRGLAALLLAVLAACSGSGDSNAAGGHDSGSGSAVNIQRCQEQGEDPGVTEVKALTGTETKALIHRFSITVLDGHAADPSVLCGFERDNFPLSSGIQCENNLLIDPLRREVLLLTGGGVLDLPHRAVLERHGCAT